MQQRSEKIAIVAHTHARERTSAQPSRSSASTERRAPRPRRARRGRTRVRNAAETRNVAASSANAQPAPTPSTSAVASAGPANSAMVLTSAVAALPPGSAPRDRLRHQPGEAPGGRTPRRRRIPPRSRRCARSRPRRRRSARPAARAARRARDRWRPSRGGAAAGPPTRRRAAGSPRAACACAANTRPTSVGEPISVMYSASATKTIRSPIVLALMPEPQAAEVPVARRAVIRAESAAPPRRAARAPAGAGARERFEPAPVRPASISQTSSTVPFPTVTVRLPSAPKSTVKPRPLSTRNAGPPGSPAPSPTARLPPQQREAERAVLGEVDQRRARSGRARSTRACPG